MAMHSNRKRPRIMLSLAPETIAHLKGLIEAEDTKSVSRTIDLLVLFHKRRRRQVGLEFPNQDVRTKFFSYCAKNKYVPEKGLATLVNFALEHK